MSRLAKGVVVELQRKRGTVFALRFHDQHGQRQYETLPDGWSRKQAESELAYRLQQVARGIYEPPRGADEPERQNDPTLYDFAQGWRERRRYEVEPRTREHWAWALDVHLYPLLARHRLSQFDGPVGRRLIDGFKTAKLREREQLNAQMREWAQADPTSRGPRPPQPLSNGSINKLLKVLAQVLASAVKHGHLETNPAVGDRLKASKPKRTFLELDEVTSLLAAAGQHRALVATMTLAGTRVGEACNARWRDADLARGKLRIPESKSDAGERIIDISPLLLDELKMHKASAGYDKPSDFIFPTRNGTRRHRSNVTRSVLKPAITRANQARARDGLPPIEGVTNHSLRRTFASLLYEAGASPAYVMAQMGHESSSLALEVYAKVQERTRDTGARMDALVRPPDWAVEHGVLALPGTNAADTPDSVLTVENERPRLSGAF
jgi:integrase